MCALLRSVRGDLHTGAAKDTGDLDELDGGLGCIHDVRFGG